RLRAARIDRLHAIDHEERPMRFLAADSEGGRLTLPAARRDTDTRLRPEHVRDRVIAAKLDLAAVDDRHSGADLTARRLDDARRDDDFLEARRSLGTDACRVDGACRTDEDCDPSRRGGLL